VGKASWVPEMTRKNAGKKLEGLPVRGRGEKHYAPKFGGQREVTPEGGGRPEGAKWGERIREKLDREE